MSLSCIVSCVVVWTPNEAENSSLISEVSSPEYACNMITKYASTLYIGMDEVFQHHAHTFEKSDLNFHFQCEFSSVTTEWQLWATYKCKYG